MQLSADQWLEFIDKMTPRQAIIRTAYLMSKEERKPILDKLISDYKAEQAAERAARESENSDNDDFGVES